MEDLSNSDKSIHSDSESEEIDKLTEVEPEGFYEEYYLYKKRVINPPTKRVKSHMFIKKQTNVQKCVAYCIDLMYNKQYPYVKLSAISQNMDKAVFIAEQLKRKVKNLHQINELETFHYNEVYTPKEEPTEERFKFKISKFSTSFMITLTRVVPKNKTHYGYQIPLQINLVSPRDPRDYIKYVLEQSRQPKKKELMSNSRKNYQNRNNLDRNHQNNNNNRNYQNKNNNRNHQNNNRNYQNNNNYQNNYQNNNNNRNYNNNKNYNNDNNNFNNDNNNRDYVSKPHHNFRKKKQNQYSDHTKPKNNVDLQNDNYYKKKTNQNSNNDLGYVKKGDNNHPNNEENQNQKKPFVKKKFRERKLKKEVEEQKNKEDYYKEPKAYEFGRVNDTLENEKEHVNKEEEQKHNKKKRKRNKKKKNKNQNEYFKKETQDEYVKKETSDEYVKKVDPRETNEYRLKEEK